jgi:hypothetical protein
MKFTKVRPAVAALFIACGVGVVAQAPKQQYSKGGINRMFLDANASDKPTYSRSEVKKMIRDAKTSEDFGRLADYFDYRAMEFEQKSREQAKELLNVAEYSDILGFSWYRLGHG